MRSILIDAAEPEMEPVNAILLPETALPLEFADNQQIHAGNVGRVVTQEGSPFLARRSTPLDHILGDA